MPMKNIATCAAPAVWAVRVAFQPVAPSFAPFETQRFVSLAEQFFDAKSRRAAERARTAISAVHGFSHGQFIKFGLLD